MFYTLVPRLLRRIDESRDDRFVSLEHIILFCLFDVFMALQSSSVQTDIMSWKEVLRFLKF